MAIISTGGIKTIGADCTIQSTTDNVIVTLGDSAGVKKFQVKDSGGVEIFSVDSDGQSDTAQSIKLGTTSDTTNGRVRYTGSDFEGRLGGSWVSLTSGGSGTGKFYVFIPIGFSLRDISTNFASVTYALYSRTYINCSAIPSGCTVKFNNYAYSDNATDYGHIRLYDKTHATVLYTRNVTNTSIAWLQDTITTLPTSGSIDLEVQCNGGGSSKNMRIVGTWLEIYK